MRIPTRSNPVLRFGLPGRHLLTASPGEDPGLAEQQRPAPPKEPSVLFAQNRRGTPHPERGEPRK